MPFKLQDKEGKVAEVENKHVALQDTIQVSGLFPTTPPPSHLTCAKLQNPRLPYLCMASQTKGRGSG